MKQVWLYILAALGSLGATVVGSHQPPEPVTISPLQRVNTALMEFAPTFYGDGIVYVARRSNGRIDQRTGQVFYELMHAEWGNNGEMKRPRPFSIELNSAYHEGPVSFSSDQREIFFTRSNTRHGLSRANDRGQVGLKIYRAYWGNYDWQGIEELPINDDEFSCMHPSLSADGNRLFFASNRPGGYGGLDLYVSDYRNGEWTQAVNLGPRINTSGDEAFPFIHQSGHLFFSSDGHPGHGGLDLFSIDLGGPSWGKVYNLEPPFNSSEDDLGLVLKADATEGYLSSNRNGGIGQDDIYRLSIPDGLAGIARKPTTRELVTVYDGAQSLRLRQAEVLLYEIDADSLLAGGAYTYDVSEIEAGLYRIDARRRPPSELSSARQTTDREGTAELLLNEGQSYLLVVYRIGFEPRELRFEYGPDGPSRPLEISLLPSDCILLEGRVESGSTNEGVADAHIRLEATNCNQLIHEVRSDQDGNYRICLPRSCQYNLSAWATGYAVERSQLNTIDTRMGRLRADVQLNSAGDQPQMALPPEAVLILDKMDWQVLQQGAGGRLELLRQFLLDYPGQQVRVAIHVDTRGHETFNLDRSAELAQLAKEYLTARGIAEERLEVVGYGERFPRKPCLEGQNCTEEDHARNNRVEVQILQ